MTNNSNVVLQLEEFEQAYLCCRFRSGGLEEFFAAQEVDQQSSDIAPRLLRQASCAPQRSKRQKREQGLWLNTSVPLRF